MRWSSVPCPISAANHHFIWHYFCKIRICFDSIWRDFHPVISLRRSRAGNRISLNFSALQVSLHNCRSSPPLAVTEAGAVPHLAMLSPLLELWTQSLSPFAEPSVTSIPILLPMCSFLFSLQISPTTDTFPHHGCPFRLPSCIFPRFDGITSYSLFSPEKLASRSTVLLCCIQKLPQQAELQQDGSPHLPVLKRWEICPWVRLSLSEDPPTACHGPGTVLCSSAVHGCARKLQRQGHSDKPRRQRSLLSWSIHSMWGDKAKERPKQHNKTV